MVLWVLCCASWPGWVERWINATDYQMPCAAHSVGSSGGSVVDVLSKLCDGAPRGTHTWYPAGHCLLHSNFVGNLV